MPVPDDVQLIRLLFADSALCNHGALIWPTRVRPADESV